MRDNDLNKTSKLIHQFFLSRFNPMNYSFVVEFNYFSQFEWNQ